MSCIKSIQRGTGNASTTSFTINEVDPDKCIVIINGIVTTSRSGYATNITGVDKQFWYGDSYGGATLSSITTTTLTFSNVKNTFGWQLIEFA